MIRLLVAWLAGWLATSDASAARGSNAVKFMLIESESAVAGASFHTRPDHRAPLFSVGHQALLTHTHTPGWTEEVEKRERDVPRPKRRGRWSARSSLLKAQPETMIDRAEQS